MIESQGRLRGVPTATGKVPRVSLILPLTDNVTATQRRRIAAMYRKVTISLTLLMVGRYRHWALRSAPATLQPAFLMHRKMVPIDSGTKLAIWKEGHLWPDAPHGTDDGQERVAGI
jgi:hypothetical protein